MSLKNFLIFDEKVTSAIRLKDTDNHFKPFAAFFAHSGDSWFVLVALLFIWLATRDNWHHLAALMAGSVVILAVLVLAVKFTIRRRRPEGDWGAIYRNTDPHSFPSGHAARTAMLSVLAFALGTSWLGITIMIWALLVSLARVWMGVHYLSDILAGMVLGVAFGFLIVLLAPWFYSLIPFVFTNQTALLSF